MDNYLQNFIPRVEEIKEILLHPQSSEKVTIEDVRKLNSFIDDFGDTNQLIDETGQMADDDIGELQRIVSAMSGALDTILSADLSIWEDVNFEKIVNSHINSYYKIFQDAHKVSTKLWRDYQALGNRLDYLSLDSDEYRQLDKKCELAKKEYDRAHTITKKAWDSMSHEKSLCSDVFFFKISFITSLSEKIKQIVDAVAQGIDELRKEGI